MQVGVVTGLYQRTQFCKMPQRRLINTQILMICCHEGITHWWLQALKCISEQRRFTKTIASHVNLLFLITAKVHVPLNTGQLLHTTTCYVMAAGRLLRIALIEAARCLLRAIDVQRCKPKHSLLLDKPSTMQVTQSQSLSNIKQGVIRLAQSTVLSKVTTLKAPHNFSRASLLNGSFTCHSKYSKVAGGSYGYPTVTGIINFTTFQFQVLDSLAKYGIG